MTASTGRAADLREVQAAPGHGRADEVEAVSFDQGNRHEVRLDAPPPQLLGEAADVPLRASVGERGLDGEDQDPGRFVQRGTRPMRA